MPKTIELTVEIDIQRVSCPGVWLCQDGRVSLTVFALGTSYQTCLLPPVFPLTFKDVFYFRKRFQETCALNNICCLLKEETIYCELVQWCDDCVTNECVILAQYLGALNDVLFPPNMCSNEGVDLLMRRSKEFPGILSPKIEIATKVRIDEVWNQPMNETSALKVTTCLCSPREESKRQKQVCHTARYHRNMCVKHGRSPSLTRSRSRSNSCGSRSCSSFQSPKDLPCDCPNPITRSSLLRSPRQPRRRHNYREFSVYNCNVQTQADATWRNTAHTRLSNDSEYEEDSRRSMSNTEKGYTSSLEDDRQPKTLLESRYIDHHERCPEKSTHLKDKSKKYSKHKISPCVCEICKRYHELFHTKSKGG